MVQVDYSNEESIKNALTGVDVVISTVSVTALDVQVKIAAAAKKAGVQLFVPSEYGGISEEETEGLFGAKANMQSQLKALGMPYAAFYTGPFADFVWVPYVHDMYLLWLFRPVNHKFTGSSASMSPVGKCLLVATATSRLRSPPDPMLPDISHTS